MLKRNQDVRRPEVLSFDFTDAASRAYLNVPETIEIVRRLEVLSFDFTNAASRTYRNVPETIDIVRRPEVLSFDFTDAASRTYRNVPETIEINCSCRDASSVWRGGIDMVSSAFASCIW
jgi:allophanate hydrolase subunit 2